MVGDSASGMALGGRPTERESTERRVSCICHGYNTGRWWIVTKLSMYCDLLGTIPRSSHACRVRDRIARGSREAHGDAGSASMARSAGRVPSRYVGSVGEQIGRSLVTPMRFTSAMPSHLLLPLWEIRWLL